MLDRRSLLSAIATAPLVSACSGEANALAADVKRLPAPSLDAAKGAALQKAVFAGGCFWGVQAVFAHTKGVRRSVSGYAGGTAKTANYTTVSSGRTGHAEAVEVTFDPAQVSYGRLLQIFFSVATDPTQLNRQHPDVGPQYRNEIFVIGDEQKRVAQAYIAQLGAARAFPQPIVTKVSPLEAFYPAEAYHQDYLFLHPDQPYIATYDQPKIRALKALFPEQYSAKPVRYARA